MDFKYYDLLSCIIVGFFTMMAYLYAFGIDYNEDYTLAYIAASYVVGYIINALSSLLEDFWNWTIGGKPSEKLLTVEPSKKYTGISKVRFYEAEDALTKLKKEVGDVNAPIGRLFARAMSYSSDNAETRVPTFLAVYAFSRVLLTSISIVTIVLIATSYSDWHAYLTIPVLIICWNRFRERSYYYAREVLNEYLKKKG